MTELLAQEVGSETSALPEGWTYASFGDLADYLNGRAFKKSDWKDTGRPIIRIQNLTNSSETVNRFPDPVEERYLVRDGDLLISWSATLGAYIYRGEEAVLNQHIFKVRPYVDEGFLYYLTVAYIEELRRQAHGSGMQHITKGKFESTGIPLPPLNEQRRIVEKIEELFTRLDAGVEALKHAQAQLKKYRQSVLNAAVTGELSRQWREAHADELEPASELLERILEERRERWTGKRYKEPVEPDTEGLPELPSPWTWVRLESVAIVKGGITKDSKRKHETFKRVPYLRVANVQRGYLDLSEMKEIDAPESVIDQLRLEPGDVLFNEGGDRDKLGRGWVWEGQFPSCIHQNHVFRARLYNDEVEPKFVSWFGNTYGQAWFMRQGKQTTNLASINLTKLSAFPVPLPPSEEQSHIVSEVDRRFSVIDQLEATIEESLKRSESLRQSILKRAFSGTLVEQNPEDEPASTLLDRIREERQASDKKGKKRSSEKDESDGEPSLFSASEG